MKPEDRITIIHCANIYPLIFCFTGILVAFSIQSLLGDLYGKESSASAWCISTAFMFPVLCTTLYWAFVNQAIFRLCRIVYATHKWLQHFWLYIIIPPIEFILSCALLSPLLFWHDIVYLPQEYFCYVPYTNILGILWVILNAYGNPLLILLFIYLRITIFLRRQSINQALVVKKRQERDLLVIRRIFITVGLLLTLGIPSVILLLMYLITGEESPLFFRIEWLSVSLSMVGLSVVLVFFTPQLKSIILKKYQRNQIVPSAGSVADSVPIGVLQSRFK
ncbi:unnamed protein product [Adineta steineri]|uniref:G-protein coupled receptors family 1 profile domain-containing protein n=2 Tax=Adineta steineri TaxID=433720 RepID=A0A819BD96_9BILA|nr:unnamed protein product [Adineta steineri]CAF0846442.1 unnamed protein product [Adineta steineri]CAF0916764.1 unnamed protein product [Adineta steineri]CAF3794797.1 unnamed protein product [Adineta steineri]CAF4027622.1 unnamed protein product [Adineta steineri]